jgi:hypothetical protein
MLYSTVRNSHSRAIAVVALSVISTALSAQTPAAKPMTMPDSAQMVAAASNAMRMMKPAQFVLDHKTDLALSPEQVSFLEYLVVAQRDSAVARQTRQMTQMQASNAKRPTSSLVSAMAWTGTIDEQAIKDGACQQSAMQAEIMLNLSRDRHAVGAILTPAQIEKMPMVEAGDMMKAMKKP